MFRFKTIAVCMFLLVVLFNQNSFSQSADKDEIDSFYAGIAEVIENNGQNPDACVAQVEQYFNQNSATVTKIKNAAAQGLEQVGEYLAMSDEEALALEEQAAKQKEAKIPAGIEKYSNAMQEFSMQNPQQGMQLANMIMKYLMPDNWYIPQGAMQE